MVRLPGRLCGGLAKRGRRETAPPACLEDRQEAAADPVADEEPHAGAPAFPQRSPAGVGSSSEEAHRFRLARPGIPLELLGTTGAEGTSGSPFRCAVSPPLALCQDREERSRELQAAR